MLRPFKESETLSGPKRGCVPSMDTCVGKYSFIQRAGSSLTEETSHTRACSVRNGAILLSTMGNLLMGTARMTVSFPAASCRDTVRTEEAFTRIGRRSEMKTLWFRLRKD